MKRKLIFILGIFAIVLSMSSCKLGVYSQEGGKADQAYLIFVSSNSYSDKVKVTIDNQTQFEAKVVKEKKSKIKGDVYAIATGRRRVKVEKDGAIIYNKDVFVSTQETKTIVLP